MSKSNICFNVVWWCVWWWCGVW